MKFRAGFRDSFFVRESAMRSSNCVAGLICLGALIQSTDAKSIPGQPGSPADGVVAHYCAAWSTVDQAARDALLAEVWADDGEYVDPQPVRVTGRAAITSQILRFQHDFPGTSFRCGAVQAHHGFVRYTWVMIGLDGTAGFHGMDFGEINSDGRLVRIVSFFDAAPRTN
jgi:hypothetical protein